MVAEQRRRPTVFGEAVEEYDAARPGYPEELALDVLGYAAAGPGPGAGANPGTENWPAVEVGAGTGKATVLFAGRGIRLTCVEPDPRMAAVLRRNVRDFPDVTVADGPFETWRPPAGARPRLLISAQAWHWVDPALRWDKAASVLTPGGTIALWWNGFAVAGQQLSDALRAIHRKHGVAELSGQTLDTASESARRPPGAESDWPLSDLAADGRFTSLERRDYQRRLVLTPRLYSDLLTSMSAYRLLDASLRDSLLADVTAAAERSGSVPMEVRTRLYLARTEAAG
jgi:SAM-dependent methyltransferase